VTDWERLGGEDGVRAAVGAFVGRFFDDPIIGYLFEGRDRERIVRHEVELASLHLGGGLGYKGRGIGSTHAPLRINRGQFRRRLAIVRQVLLQHGAPDDVVDRWIAHERRLESVITDGTDCVPDGS
jgi:hemoglobin